MTEVIIYYLKSWMREFPPTFLAKITTSLLLHCLLTQAILDQEKIVWDHFLSGCVSTLWTTIQQSHNKQQYAHTWQQKSIHRTQKLKSFLWEVRNTLQFGNGKEKLTRKQHRLSLTITNYYNNYHHIISNKHYNIFNTPLALWLIFTPTENKQWINTVKAAQKIYKREQ